MVELRAAAVGVAFYDASVDRALLAAVVVEVEQRRGEYVAAAHVGRGRLGAAFLDRQIHQAEARNLVEGLDVDDYVARFVLGERRLAFVYGLPELLERAASVLSYLSDFASQSFAYLRHGCFTSSV